MAASHRSRLKYLLLSVSYRGLLLDRLLTLGDPSQEATLSLLPYVVFSQTPSDWISVQLALRKH